MLIAPLDWGLGHATRCIPLIKFLLKIGSKVIIAADGDRKILLADEFPDLEMVDLKGYGLKYGTTKWRTISRIIFQIPKILIAINREKKWLTNFIKHKHLDIVISDNRFGLHNKRILSVFMTHQLLIKTSFGKWVDLVVQKMNYYFVNQFDYCLVPDAAEQPNLGGELSHPAIKPNSKIMYTGVLSRIENQALPISNKLLIILSGPEPQRSILERILLAQLVDYSEQAILVRGLPGNASLITAVPSVTVYNYLSAPALQQAINQSEIIISRSGYSTIMDVLPLGKKCIFIPTPGQAEQEYLAARLAQLNYACMALQDNFSLPFMISKADKLQPPDLSSLLEPESLGKAVSVLTEKFPGKK